MIAKVSMAAVAVLCAALWLSNQSLRTARAENVVLQLALDGCRADATNIKEDNLSDAEIDNIPDDGLRAVPDRWLRGEPGSGGLY